MRHHSDVRLCQVLNVAPNLLKKDFAVERPDHRWLTDIACIPTREGWLYMAAILDLYSRQIVGWAMSEQMTAALTIAALKVAIRPMSSSTVNTMGFAFLPGHPNRGRPSATNRIPKKRIPAAYSTNTPAACL